MSELTNQEKLVFGADAKRHPVTGMVLETGKGALPEKQQALIHLGTIHREQGKDVADAMLLKIVNAGEAAVILERMKAAEPEPARPDLVQGDQADGH